jgi:hypothetical protein
MVAAGENLRHPVIVNGHAVTNQLLPFQDLEPSPLE